MVAVLYSFSLSLGAVSLVCVSAWISDYHSQSPGSRFGTCMGRTRVACSSAERAVMLLLGQLPWEED